jgi:photosystem II stability/assembly factor-like uncharacterized protein
MRYIIITFIVSFIVLVDLRGQWEIINDSLLYNNHPPCRGCYNSFRDVCYIDEDKGFIIESHNVHMGKWSGVVFMTSDRGKTWSTIFSSNNIYGLQFKTCVFTNNSNGFIAGDGLYQTLNGGVTWTKKDNGLPFITDLFYVNEYTGFATADSSVFKTTNGGESWERILNPNAYNLNSIFFIDENMGWAVGDNGHIIKLTSQGAYEAIASGTTLPLNKVFFADSNTGWIAGGFNNASGGFHPVLLRTVNGGESWSEIENINWLIHDLYFINDKEGWSVGADSTGLGTIIATIDGGNNWYVQVDSLRAPLNAIEFKNGNGWAVGGKGLVLKMSNAPFVTFRSVHAVCVDAEAFNLTQGSPVGGIYSGPGITISPQFDPAIAGVGPHTITYTCTDSTGYSTSATQTITVNALPEITIGPLPALPVHTAPFNLSKGSPPGGIYSGTGITVSPAFNPAAAGVGTHTITYTYTDYNGCTNSAIQTITLFDSVSTRIEDNEIYDNNVVLFQNYPNSFISNTLISYQLSAISNVELSVYDIMGRRVKTVVKEEQQPGRYEVELDAEGMTPGIYFCELKAGHGRQIKKMIKIK